MRKLINLKFYGYLIIVYICAPAFANFAQAQVASGGNYTLTQTAISNGGASGASASSGGNYSIEGTIGQSAAGTNQQNSSFIFQPGFWTAQILDITTAANATVSGRVKTADGNGIKNVIITLIGGNGETRTAISSSFGYFTFDNVEVGNTYIFSISAKRYTFSQTVQVLTVNEDTSDLFFIANE